MGEMIAPRPFALSRSALQPDAEPRRLAARSFLPWALDAPALIIVDRDRHELSLYRNGLRALHYPVVFGRNAGRKLFEGDRRTPIGLYRVTAKRAHPRFDRFLDLSYPNGDDVAFYRKAVAAGQVPDEGRRGPGGLVGIHGSDQEELNRLGIDWTFGCISLVNRDVEELYDAVPEGTLVLIRDGDSLRPARSLPAQIEPATAGAEAQTRPPLVSTRFAR